MRNSRLPKPVAGERRPVTLGQCRQKIALSLCVPALVVAALIGGHHGSWSTHLYLVFYGLVFLARAYYWLNVMRQIRRGERFETLYSAVPPATVQSQVRSARIAAIGVIIIGLLLSLLLLMSATPAFPVLGVLIINAVCAAFVVALYGYTKLFTHKLQTRVAKVEVLPQLSAIEEASSRCDQHWWTDTQTREEAKVMARR